MFFCFFIITDSNRQYAPGISFPFRHLSLEPQSIFFLFNLRNRFFRCMIYLQFEITVLYLSYGSLLFKTVPCFTASFLCYMCFQNLSVLDFVRCFSVSRKSKCRKIPSVHADTMSIVFFCGRRKNGIPFLTSYLFSGKTISFSGTPSDLMT